MSDIVDKYSHLSPAKRALLTQRLLKKNGEQASRHEPIPRRNGNGALPLSYAQERLWLLEQLEPGTHAYNLPLAARITGALDQEAFVQSLREIQRRHEILRTVFEQVEGKPVQIVCEKIVPAFEIIDLSARAAAEREAEVFRLAQEEGRYAFDLSRGPLFRGKLLRVSQEEHVLLLGMHHLVADGWSVELIGQELAALYHAFAQRKSSPLPEFPIQYADYALWQRSHLAELEQHVAYWRNKLAGAPPFLELPTDRLRPATPSYAGGLELFRLPAELSHELLALSRRENVTVFMLLLAAFQVLLARYSGQEDLVLGTPIANRNRPELEKLIGFFVNTLVLRTSLEGNPTFRELLHRVRETTLEAYGHQELPFEKIVEELQPVRNLSYSPIFQVMFILQPPSAPAPFERIKITPMPIHNGTAKFDLLLNMANLPEGFAGAFEYGTDLFEAATIKRMAGHFQRLLQGIVENPAQRIAGLPILTEHERAQMLVEWNNTARAYPEEKCFHELFEAQAERTPEAVAVVCDEQQLTYRELNRRANQLAHYLVRRCGIGAETLVGLCVERSLEMMIGLLGIMKAGAAYVPLDPNYPQERIVYVLQDAQAPLLITQSATLSNFEFSFENIKALCLDTEWKNVAKEDASNANVALAPENLAYAIYTSGSTGKPKGVGIPHRALTNFLAAMRARPGLTEQDILLAVTTLSFDIAGLELYLPLLQGARVVLAQREAAAEGRHLIKALAASNATLMQATPATWHMLIAAGWQGAAHLKALCGGEALPRELAHALLQRCAAVWNMYGPTETTIWSAVHQLAAHEALINIGKPIANTQIYVADRHQQAVPIGVHGELLIGGDGLARGYLNRPDLTAEKFVPNPFVVSTIPPLMGARGVSFAALDNAHSHALQPDAPSLHEMNANGNAPVPTLERGIGVGARLYRTGDLARYLPNGNVDCLGRSDHQIKLRGFRIELGEVEALCAQHPSIAQAVAIVREDVPGDKRLVAYLVARSGVSDQLSVLSNQSPAANGPQGATSNQLPATSNELRAFLLKHLPEYMVPSVFVFMDALPATPNGKVDRKALPPPAQEVFAAEKDFVAPRNSVEQLLAEIWVEVLGLTRVSVLDNFFELGGHSLLAVRLFLEIERSFHRSLPLASIFKAPTIKQLAAMICDAEALPSTGCLVALQEEGKQPPLFCVSGLEGHTFNFRQLARHLGNEQPMYGLQYPGLEGREQPLETVEAIAAEFIHHIRGVQPHGPYHLIGLCFGGLVVYEIAQQLARLGERTALLALIDAFAPEGLAGSSRLHLLKFSARRFNRLDKNGKLEFLKARAPWLRRWLKRTNDAAQRHGETSLADWIAAVQSANIAAQSRYHPQPYAGRVVLFHPTKRGEGWEHLQLAPDHGWGKLARGGVEVHAISGYHNKMFREPKVGRLAKKLAAYLNEKKPRQEVTEAETFDAMMATAS